MRVPLEVYCRNHKAAVLHYVPEDRDIHIADTSGSSLMMKSLCVELSDEGCTKT